MRKNISIALLAIAAVFAVVLASYSFFEHKGNLAELETEISTSAPQKGEEGAESIPEIEETGFAPHSTDNTNPENFGLKTEIYSGTTKIDKYSLSGFYFGNENNYSALEGIITFRGNNYRDSAVYGSAKLENKGFEDTWQVTTGTLPSGSGYPAWTGSGWTGQPLIVKWDNETKNNMNIFPEKKAKENLVEVIYATMSGTIYFLDLEDGTPTRDSISLGYTFKGAGALDPRGYPIMYVGAGDYNPKGASPKMFIINLLDCTVLKEYNGSDSIAHRTWGAFDSSALVCASTDTLVYPCENGLIYTIRLNSHYDKANGTLSINPDEPVKLRVTTSRSNATTYWYGFETSPVIYEQYMYIADNGGYLYCIDMNTLEVIWMQDVVDDTNCSPVLEKEGDKVYIYISTSLHWTQVGGRGDIPVFKIDAETGEIVWKQTFNCTTIPDTSGGVQGTIALGKNDCADLIFVPLAHFPDRYRGGIAALKKDTGKQVWFYDGKNYTWSSPVVVTGEDGVSVVINADVSGELVMLNAKTGELIRKITPGSLIEASPAVYDDMLILGLRNQKIKGIKLV